MGMQGPGGEREGNGENSSSSIEPPTGKVSERWSWKRSAVEAALIGPIFFATPLLLTIGLYQLRGIPPSEAIQAGAFTTYNIENTIGMYGGILLGAGISWLVAKQLHWI